MVRRPIPLRNWRSQRCHHGDGRRCGSGRPAVACRPAHWCPLRRHPHRSPPLPTPTAISALTASSTPPEAGAVASAAIPSMKVVHPQPPTTICRCRCRRRHRRRRRLRCAPPPSWCVARSSAAPLSSSRPPPACLAPVATTSSSPTNEGVHPHKESHGVCHGCGASSGARNVVEISHLPTAKPRRCAAAAGDPPEGGGERGPGKPSS
jgi:hypothetical protein